MASKVAPSSPAQLVELLAGRGLRSFKEFLARQRWFAAKARAIESVAIEDWTALDAEAPIVLLLLKIDGERYYVPLSVCASTVAERADVISDFGAQVLVDAHSDPDLGRHLLSAMAANRELSGGAGRFVCRSLPPLAGRLGEFQLGSASRRISGEQSNTSVVFDRTLILKSIRRPQRGVNPELEVLHFLTSRTRFRNVPNLVGWLEYVGSSEDSATLAVLQGFIENAGDGWQYTVTALEVALGGPRARGRAQAARASRAATPDFLAADMRTLGEVTGGLHAALASNPGVPDFSPEPVMRQDVDRWSARIAEEVETLIADIGAAGSDSLPDLGAIQGLLRESGPQIDRTLAGLGVLASPGTHKIRVHGDYHLGQVLKTRDGFSILDFEGEPARPLEERRAKQPPLRDVAGMLRSLSYAAHTVARARRVPRPARELGWLADWEARARDAFLGGYLESAEKSPVRLCPSSIDEVRRACAALELEKVCYEVRYELNTRPDWLSIPARGLARLLGLEGDYYRLTG